MVQLSEGTLLTLKNLTPKEEKVLRQHFEHNSDNAILPEFQITRERLRQIEAKALKKLRDREIPDDIA